MVWEYTAYTVSRFQSSYFWILLVIMFYSEIISSIFAPCLVHGFTIDLNVCPSLFWIHFSSVQVRVFVKKSYIHSRDLLSWACVLVKKCRRLVLEILVEKMLKLKRTFYTLLSLILNNNSLPFFHFTRWMIADSFIVPIR